MSVGATVGMELLAITHADKHMAKVQPNLLLVMLWQLGQVSFMHYFGGAARSMDHQHEFRQAGIFQEVLTTVVALGRTSRAERRMAGDLVPWEAFSSPNGISTSFARV